MGGIKNIAYILIQSEPAGVEVLQNKNRKQGQHTPTVKIVPQERFPSALQIKLLPDKFVIKEVAPKLSGGIGGIPKRYSVIAMEGIEQHNA